MWVLEPGSNPPAVPLRKGDEEPGSAPADVVLARRCDAAMRAAFTLNMTYALLGKDKPDVRWA